MTKVICGLFAEIKNSVPYTKGIIVDATKYYAKLSCLEVRSVFDRTKNEYHTIKQYFSSWYSWDSIKVIFPIVETYRIVVNDTSKKCFVEFAEGEVYSFKYHGKTIKLGINKSIGETKFNITDISTGTCLKTDSDILKLRCSLVKEARSVVEQMENDSKAYQTCIEKLNNLPMKYITLNYIGDYNNN